MQLRAKNEEEEVAQVIWEKEKITGPKIDSASKKLLTFSALLDKTVSQSKFKSEIKDERKRKMKP